MRKIVSFTLISLLIAGLLYYFFNPNQAAIPQSTPFQAEQELADLTKAKELLSQGKAEEALLVIDKYKKDIEKGERSSNQWLDLYIQALTKTHDAESLSSVFLFSPQTFKNHEEATLLVSENFIQKGDVENFEAARALWNGKETMINKWFVLDADRLILQGQSKKASAFLKSHTFKGKEDIDRLVRLAILSAQESPKEAWEYLQEAKNKDPNNAEIRSYRGRLLESVGKNTLAHNEYQGAINLDPSNLFYKDQLAEFYIRNKQYPLGISVWKETFEPEAKDSMVLRAWFWNHVAQNQDIKWNSLTIEKGPLTPLIAYLFTLPQDDFWNQKSFEKIPNSTNFLKNQQATFWLKVIAALKNGEEKQAQDLLKFNPFRSNSWNPELTVTLERILQYRQNGTFKTDEAVLGLQDSRGFPMKEMDTNPYVPPFFKQLDYFAKNGSQKVKIPQDLHELLMSSDAFAAAFISAGWNEAGLALQKMDVVPKELPEWVSFNIAEAIQMNRGTDEALKWAEKQPANPSLTALIGDLLIKQGKGNEALEKLQALAKENSEEGFKAAWTSALYLIDQKKYAEAKKVIAENSKLEQDLVGKETIARIAVLEGDQKKADSLYEAISNQSSEARSYLAKRAFDEKNWPRAKELTEALLQEFPDNPTLQENMKKILEKETH